MVNVLIVNLRIMIVMRVRANDKPTLCMVYNMKPMTANEALNLLIDVIDGKDISWHEIERAKAILKLFIKEAHNV